MKYAYDVLTGTVLGLNRGAVDEEETTGVCTPQDLVFGMDVDMYKVVDGVLTPLTEEEIEMVEAEKEKEAQLALIPETRYKMETADLEFEGMLFKYGREDRTLLESTLEKIRRGLVPAIEWHCINGYFMLTPENIDALEIAGLMQVQGAFTWAKETEKAILNPVEEVEVAEPVEVPVDGGTVEGGTPLES